MRRYDGEEAFDPVCGRLLDPEAALRLEVRGERYSFCSRTCLERFQVRADRDRVRSLARMGVLLADQKARWGAA